MEVQAVAFRSIGFHTALILNKLRNTAQLTEEQKHSEDEEGAAYRGNGKHPKEHPDAEREYVEHRLRELAAWERKISGRRR